MLNNTQKTALLNCQILHFPFPVKQREVKYWVDMCIGQCTCPQGKDGSPCSHQAAIVLHYGSPSVNCIPVMDPKAKQKLAYIAHGEEALKDFSFYCTLNQSTRFKK